MSGGHYGPGLTRIHDAGFTSHVRGAIPVVLERVRAVAASGLVVDLGCGGGLLTAALCGAGYDVLAVDISPDMVGLARTRAPAARVECASCFSAPIPGCVAVVSIGEVLNYAADPAAGEESLRSLFARVHRALAPGGLLLFDVAEPGRCPGGESVRSWVEPGWALFCRTREREGGRLTREIASFCLADGVWTRADEVHELRLYPREWVRRTLEECGFEASLIPAYGETPFPPGHGAHEARKR